MTDQMFRKTANKRSDKVGNVEINLTKTFFIDLMDSLFVLFSLSASGRRWMFEGLSLVKISNVQTWRKRTREWKQINRMEGWAWGVRLWERFKKYLRDFFPFEREWNRKQLLHYFDTFSHLSFGLLLFISSVVLTFFQSNGWLFPETLSLHCLKLLLFIRLRLQTSLPGLIEPNWKEICHLH